MKTKMVTLFMLLALLTSTISAGNMPFPQSADYGLKPSGTPAVLGQDIQDLYDWYKTTFLNTSGSSMYFEAKDTYGTQWTQTVSEQHGYGMMISAILDDKATFDGLLNYYHQYSRAGGLMDWKVWSGGSSDDGSATDGDMDIAYACLLAYKQWGNQSYKDLAYTIITGIWNYEMYTSNNLLPTPGDSWWAGTIYGSDKYTRPSDWMTGHYRAFGDYGHGDWERAIDSTYAFYNAHKNSSTGLVPDFFYGYAPATGGNVIEAATDGQYHYNACRVPLRFAMDYAVSGSSTAQAALQTIGNWINGASSGSAANIASGYYLNGTPYNTNYTAIEFQGPFGAGLIATNHQALMNSIWYELTQSYNYGYDDGQGSYGTALGILSMLVMSGNWWGPDAVSTGGPGDIDTTKIIFDDFENAYHDESAQTFLGAASGISWGDSIALADSNDYFYDQAYVGGGFWYAYGDASSGGSSSVKSPSGQDVEANFNDGVSNGMLDVVMTNVSSASVPYGYAVVEAPIFQSITKTSDTTVTNADLYFNMTKMDAIIITYSSDQPVWLSFGTKDIEALAWGSWGRKLPATTGMVTDTIQAALLVAEEYSPLAENVTADPDTWNWAASGAPEVKTIAFNALGDSGTTQVTNLKVDKIVFNGINLNDFGITYRDPATPISQPVARASKGMALTHQLVGNEVSLNFSLTSQSNVKAALFTPAGRKVAEVSANGLVGANNMRLSTRGFAQGLYLLRFEAAGAVQTMRINLMR